MIDYGDLPLLGGAAFLAALVGSVAGSGGTAVLMPVLVLQFGVRDAIPILTIANMVSNLSRAGFNRREIVLPVVGWFSLGAIPLALAGALLFTVTPPEVLLRMLGGFLILMVAWRRLSPRPPRIGSVRWFAPLGAGFGLLGGLLEGVGPLMAPFFLAYGLLRGAYIGTDALATLFVQFTKLAVFGGAEILTPALLTAGLTLAPFMIGGAWVGKLVVNRIPERVFTLIIDLTLLVAGVGFLVKG
ncbi:MAG: sulfite exporter TauE/SafE family protein [SAR324 cluster bacterium]|nr:sulfite exporter TauE/SafE family protein [SAR324 cluster bacterium]